MPCQTHWIQPNETREKVRWARQVSTSWKGKRETRMNEMNEMNPFKRKNVNAACTDNEN